MAEQDLAAANQQMGKSVAAGSTVETVYLDPKVKWESCEVLNKSPEVSNIRSHLGGNIKTNCLVSDSDCELLVSYAFTEAVHLEGIELFACNPPVNNSDQASAPEVLYFFKNQNVEFDDTEDLEPTSLEPGVFVYQMTDQDKQNLGSKEIIISLPKAKFKSTNKLTVFIQTNVSPDDDAPTFFNLMRVFGKPTGLKGIEQWEPCKS